MVKNSLFPLEDSLLSLRPNYFFYRIQYSWVIVHTNPISSSVWIPNTQEWFLLPWAGIIIQNMQCHRSAQNLANLPTPPPDIHELLPTLPAGFYPVPWYTPLQGSCPISVCKKQEFCFIHHSFIYLSIIVFCFAIQKTYNHA